MKDMVFIRPVAEPKDYSKVRFTKGEYVLAKKVGEVEVSVTTAQEAIKNSKGLYELKPPPRAEVEVKVQGLSLDAMDNAQLKLLALQMGHKVLRKNIARVDLIKYVQGKLDGIQVIDDAPEESASQDDDLDVGEDDGDEDEVAAVDG